MFWMLVKIDRESAVAAIASADPKPSSVMEITQHAYPLDSGNWGILRIQYGATTT